MRRVVVLVDLQEDQDLGKDLGELQVRLGCVEPYSVILTSLMVRSTVLEVSTAESAQA